MIGIDLVDINRVRQAANLSRVADFILHQDEKDEFACAVDQARFLASRLAVKEAVFKASRGAVRYIDICCAHEENGALIVSKIKGLKIPSISLSHTSNWCAAVALL